MKDVFIVLILIQIVLVTTLKFPNDIKGSPTIDCGRDSITINVNTSNAVASRIFAKNQYENAKCSFHATNTATFVLSECGMNRQRQLEPRGLSYNLVVVVQLHPMFITNVDKAYNLKCFYMEAAKLVTAGLEVSMLQTDTISAGTEAATGVSAMPTCNYTLHMDSPAGPLVRYAKVGDKVWHAWDCSTDTFGMLVHSCYVTDGQGNEFRVIDQTGCGIDQYVMRTPEYSVMLNKAQQEVHVFKFADKMVVLFNCQIKLCVKANDGCKGITPPDCSNVTASTGERLEITTLKPGNETSKSNETDASLKGKDDFAALKNRSQPGTNVSENVDHPIETQPSKGNQSATTAKPSSNETGGVETNKTKASGEKMGDSGGASLRRNETGAGESTNVTINPETSKNETSPGNNSTTAQEKADKGLTDRAAEAKEKFQKRLEKFLLRNETSNDTRERRHADREDRAEKLRHIMMDSVNQDELETDVAQRIWVLEPEETSPLDNFGSDVFSSVTEANNHLVDYDEEAEQHRREVCISSSKFNLVIGSLVLSLVVSSFFVISLLILLKRKRNMSSSSNGGVVADVVRPPSTYKT